MLGKKPTFATVGKDRQETASWILNQALFRVTVATTTLQGPAERTRGAEGRNRFADRDDLTNFPIFLFVGSPASGVSLIHQPCSDHTYIVQALLIVQYDEGSEM